MDAHPDIRCGEETRLVPRILQMKERWRKGKREHRRLDEAGLNNTVINLIVRNFISNVIEYHGPPAKNLCNKDPLSLLHTKDLHLMFPRAKFVLVVRDGRAVAYSIVSRNLTISGVDNKSYLAAAAFWNRVVERMWENCKYVGPDVCHVVYFEKLVSEPKNEIGDLLKFLGIEWHDNVLRHPELINKEVKLSKCVHYFELYCCILVLFCCRRMEPSTKQVKNPITSDTAVKWKRKLPKKVKDKIWSSCPMLRRIGYTNDGE